MLLVTDVRVRVGWLPIVCLEWMIGSIRRRVLGLIWIMNIRWWVESSIVSCAIIME